MSCSQTLLGGFEGERKKKKKLQVAIISPSTCEESVMERLCSKRL